jgi:hypothetical protein
VTIALQALSLVEKAGQYKFASHYAWGTNGVSECKMNVKSTWIPTWHQMDHVPWSLGLFSKTTSWRKTRHKTGRPRHPKTSQLLSYFILKHVRPCMNRNSLTQHLVSEAVTYDFTRDRTIWFQKCLGMAFGHFFHALTISRSRRSHNSWLMHVWSGPKSYFFSFFKIIFIEHKFWDHGRTNWSSILN